MPTRLDFASTCEYLECTPEELIDLTESGLVVRLGKNAFPTASMSISRYLLALKRVRVWDNATMGWYADLMFAGEIGRAILLPMRPTESWAMSRAKKWLETSYAAAVREDLESTPDLTDAPIVTPLRSLITVELDADHYWPDLDSLQQSALYPIIEHLEASGIPIMGQNNAIARDALNNYALIMLAFGRIAAPISREFAQLVQAAQENLRTMTPFHATVPADEKKAIVDQALIPVDGLYSSKATEIHSQPETWDYALGVLKAQRRTIALQLKVPKDADQALLDNIIDIVQPYLGIFGARVVQLLYETANDAPYYRNPVITIETNEILDRLGLKRDEKGYHRSNNRERLRDALNAAHNLEIIGEYFDQEKGREVRKQIYRTVLSILGATFDAKENAGISSLELRERGLPKSLQIRLNFYDGIRRPDGTLGNHYVLVPRLAAGEMVNASHAKTHELLKAYLLFRYRQTRMESRTLTVTRQTALEKANITNKHAPRATATLRKALDQLVEEGIIEGYSTPLPTKLHATFEVTLSRESVAGVKSDET